MHVPVHILNFYKTSKQILRECSATSTYNASFIASIHLAFMSSVLAKNENAFEPSFFPITKELFHCKNQNNPITLKIG